MKIRALEKEVSLRFRASEKQITAYVKSLKLLHKDWQGLNMLSVEARESQRSIAISVQKRQSGNANTRESFPVYDHKVTVTYLPAINVTVGLIDYELRALEFITSFAFRASPEVSVVPAGFLDFPGCWKARPSLMQVRKRYSPPQPHYTARASFYAHICPEHEMFLRRLSDFVEIPASPRIAPVRVEKSWEGVLGRAAEETVRTWYNDLVRWMVSSSVRSPSPDTPAMKKVRQLVARNEGIKLHEPGSTFPSALKEMYVGPELEIHAEEPDHGVFPSRRYFREPTYNRITRDSFISIDYSSKTRGPTFLHEIVGDPRFYVDLIKNPTE